MPAISLSLFSPILRSYIRRLGSTPDLCREILNDPKNVPGIFATRVKRIHIRLSHFYKILGRIDRSGISYEEKEAVKWFLENRNIIGGNVSTLLEDMQIFHDRLDGKNTAALVKTLSLFVEDSLYRLSEEKMTGTVEHFAKTHPLSTDEAQSIPFLIRLFLLSRILILSETLLMEILSRQLPPKIPPISSAITRFPDLAKKGFSIFSSLYQPLIRKSLSPSENIPPNVSSGENEGEMKFEPIPPKIESVIESLRIFDDIDWETLISSSSDADRLLTLDPAGVYAQMTAATRTAYKERLRFLSRMTKISEHRLAKQSLARAKAASIPYQRHVGYWLMDTGHEMMLAGFPSARYTFSYLLTKTLRIGYLPLLALFTLLIAGLVSSVFPFPYTPLAFFLAFFPALRNAKQLLNSIIKSFVPPAFLPALDLKKDLSEEDTTIFVIPAFLSDEATLTELLYKLEVAYLGNRGKNIHFGLLLDFPDSASLPGKQEEDLKETAKKAISAINGRYGERNAFLIFFRESLFNESEGVFMAWERKRGKLLEFMRVLRSQETKSRHEIFPSFDSHAEFIVVVDEDAHVPRDFISRIIAIHAHPLRRPFLGPPGEPPIHGSTFVQPHVGLWFKERSNILPKFFGEEPTPGHYSVRVSETYQDLFGQGNFVGKGSIHIDSFLSSLGTFFPENQILSHDLLEGSIGGTTFANDIVLYDTFPLQLHSFLERMHRWIRGDWQTAPWLFSKIRHADAALHKNYLGSLGRYKIFDNLVESLVPAAMLGILFLAFSLSLRSAILAALFLVALDLFVLIDNVFQVAYLVRSFFSSNSVEIPLRLWKFGRRLIKLLRRSFLEFGMLPYSAGTALDAIFRSLYRQCISRRHLLEWDTAAATERMGDRQKVFRTLLPGFVFILAFGFLLLADIPVLPVIAGILFFLFFPSIIRILSLLPFSPPPLMEKDRSFLTTVAQRSWEFYATFVGEKTAFLPPDHFQDFPGRKIAKYTSVSDVGFYLLSVLAVAKLGYISSEDALERIEATTGTLEKLPRHENLFYNWYSLQTLKQDEGCFISSVDVGNLLACLITVSSWLLGETRSASPKLQDKFRSLHGRIETLLHSMDFHSLVSRRKLLLAIGLDSETDALSPFFYQTLASESRLSVFLTLAKRDLPMRAWSALSRIIKRQPIEGPAALSWSGTLFEYLMPNLFFEEPRGSIMEKSSRSAYANHRAFLAERGLFGALSESGYAQLSATGDYEYKAFGVPSLALSPHADGRSVIAPYAVALALSVDPKSALSDLNRLSLQALGHYGFLEAIDYAADPLGQPVGTYMSHHQGMILGSIVNCLHDGYIQKLFSAHPLVQTVLFLTDEVAAPPTKEIFPENNRINNNSYE